MKAPTVLLQLGLSQDTPYSTNRVTILVDGVMAASANVTRGGTVIEVPVSSRRPGVLTIRSEQSFVPAQIVGNRDGRRISVQLLSLEQR